ncbi:hypothetical protein ACFWGD_01780 [Corynebacterium sp. NPDC060344]|uniref:hypothetical protein n=1 Tax=Corynebacterium sp. NPDC060344 TaxID=3347101 RepID=UPI003662F2F8
MAATIQNTKVHKTERALVTVPDATKRPGRMAEQITIGRDAWGRNCLTRTIAERRTSNGPMRHEVVKLKSLDTGQLIDMVLHVSRSASTLEALQLACHAHHGVMRRDRVLGREHPYIDHPLRNALRAFLWVADRWPGADVELVLQGCLLHDVVEDAPDRVVSFYGGDGSDAAAALGENLGPRLRAAVAAVTNPPELKKLEGGDKREAYRAHLERSLADDPVALLVKASDLWDNAGSAFYADAAFARKMTAKYLPVIRMISGMAADLGDEVVAGRVSRSMAALAQKIDVWD